MLLAIDIGNTNTAFGFFDDESLIKKWRVSTVCDRTSDELGVLLRQFFIYNELNYKKISAIIVSSVVPALNFSIEKMSEDYFERKSVFVDYAFDFGFKILYDQPNTLGSDRLVDAFAAVRKYKTPCIVCDFGTAATIDAVNSKNEFLGGIIAPGINALADALFQETSKLPKVEIVKPESVFGNSTAASIQSGIFHGYLGLVEEILRRMIKELNEKPRIVATGGFANLIAENSSMIEAVDENLLLDGLRFIHEQIKNKF